MANHFEPSAFKACYVQFQQADVDRNALVTQLLKEYDDLYQENIRMREQLEDEKETRMMWQDQARGFKNELTQTRLTTVSYFTQCMTSHQWDIH